MKAPCFLFLLIFIFLVAPTLVSASDLPIKFNQEYDLKRPCFSEGTFCNISSVCNLTAIYPNGKVLIENKLMTYHATYFNYTFVSADLNQLGFYPVVMSCCEGVLCGQDTFNLEVTGDGFNNRQFPTQFVVIIIAIIFVMVGFWFDGLRLFKYMGSILLMIMGVLTLYPGYSFINYSNLMGQGVGFICIALGFYFLIEDSFSRDNQDSKFTQNDGGLI